MFKQTCLSCWKRIVRPPAVSDYMKIAINFKWDIELDKSIFEPNIPEDYVLDGNGPSKEEMNAFLKNILLTAQ